MGVFDINYDALQVQLLPVRLRNPKMKAWIKCLCIPVRWLFNLFTAARRDTLYYLSHNSQVVYLEAALNDVFDPITRGIFISDGPAEDPLFTYLVPEHRPIWIGLASETGSIPYPAPATLYTNAETSLFGSGFIVNVPVAVSFDLYRMQALINRYRLPGRNNYEVITY